MRYLLAYVNARPTQADASSASEGAGEFDQVFGTGNARLGKDGRLKRAVQDPEW